MTTSKGVMGARQDIFGPLVEWGLITEDGLRRAEETAFARGADIEKVLLREYGVPRKALLRALSSYYGSQAAEYDERIPVPPELLAGLDGERLSYSLWFPMLRDGDTVVLAANDPSDPSVAAEVRKHFGSYRTEFRVALKEDILWYIQDYLHSRPGFLIGTERTGLAYWRNTMAHWRTRLACYRTDLAWARTCLALLRWGLGIVAISGALMRAKNPGLSAGYYRAFLAAGVLVAAGGLFGYLRVRRSRMSPPGHHTLVEVTAATLQFLEGYHFIEGAGVPTPTKGTMLARLGDFLSGHSTILYPSPASRERTHLARERNVLAGQRTVAACYRTIYARARTGLAFIRTGVSFASVGLASIGYFGFGLLTLLDGSLVLAGLLMAADGARWYMPVRKEQAELPRCHVPG